MTGRRLSLPAVLMAVMAVVLLVAFGVGQAKGARSIAEAPAFFELRGIDVSLVPPIQFVDEIEAGPYASQAGMSPRAMARSDAMIVSKSGRIGLDARDLAGDVAHEIGHYASFWRWARLDPTFAIDDVGQPRIAYRFGAYLADEAWLLVYEEGLVQAFAEAVMPDLWRYLTGKRLSPDWRANTAYSADARAWTARAVKATGERRRSRAVREWLGYALTLDPPEREALYRSLT